MDKIILTNPINVSGKYFSLKQLQQIQDTVVTFKNLSRSELAKTICEHLNWKSPNGRLKVDACLKALRYFEDQELLALPPLQLQAPSVKKTYGEYILDQQHIPLNGVVNDVMPLELQLVTSKDQRTLWNGYVERYHYLGYKKPFGPHLRYFIKSLKLHEQYLGCLLFAPAAWALRSRDVWIGWSEADRKKRLTLIVNNSRFLIFPWIKIDNLASQALALAAEKVESDWFDSYGYRPVLLETFVDPTKYDGTCYKAANWQHVGNTTGRGRTEQSGDLKNTTKKIFMYPLNPKFRSILRGDPSFSPLPKKTKSDFTIFWEQIAEIIHQVTVEHDKVWQKRNRVLNTLMLVLLIFRVLLSKNSQGYHTTIIEFWAHCHGSKLNLPQKKPIAPSSFSEAREKLDEKVFKIMNRRIIQANECQSNQTNWKGHKIFAVDGSKINLPRTLINKGFFVTGTAKSPQGMISTLYQLQSKMPYDFDLVQHSDERLCAISHLSALQIDDVVVYDRGYFSYLMLFKHVESGVHAIFRLPPNSYSQIEAFMAQPVIDDTVIIIDPSRQIRENIAKKNPEIIIKPLSLRLIKYRYKETEYTLGTTLMSSAYSITDFSDVYHSRWGIEELYKISKKHIEVDDFHGRTERKIRQELYAHFVMITISRLFANQSEIEKNSGLIDQSVKTDKELKFVSRPLNSLIKVNFKNCLKAVEFNIESLLLKNNQILSEQLNSTIKRIMLVTQRERPNRSYPRLSMKPDKRWRSTKFPNTKQKESAQNNVATTPT